MDRHEEGRLQGEASLEELVEMLCARQSQSHPSVQSYPQTLFFNSSAPATRAVTRELTGKHLLHEASHEGHRE